MPVDLVHGQRVAVHEAALDDQGLVVLGEVAQRLRGVDRLAGDERDGGGTGQQGVEAVDARVCAARLTSVFLATRYGDVRAERAAQSRQLRHGEAAVLGDHRGGRAPELVGDLARPPRPCRVVPSLASSRVPDALWGEPPPSDPGKTNAPCAGTGRRQAPQGHAPGRPRPPARAARWCGAFVHPSRHADLRSPVELVTSLRQARWTPSGGGTRPTRSCGGARRVRPPHRYSTSARSTKGAARRRTWAWSDRRHDVVGTQRWLLPADRGLLRVAAAAAHDRRRLAAVGDDPVGALAAQEVWQPGRYGYTVERRDRMGNTVQLLSRGVWQLTPLPAR